MDGRRLGMSIFGRGAVAAVIALAPLPMSGHRHPLVAALHADGIVRVRVNGLELLVFLVGHMILCNVAVAWARLSTACCRGDSRAGSANLRLSPGASAFHLDSRVPSVPTSTWHINKHPVHLYIVTRLAEVLTSAA